MSQQFDQSLFDIGGIIKRSFSELFGALFLYWGLCLIVLAPTVIVVIAIPGYGGLVVKLLQPILSLLIQACITYIVFSNAIGKKVSIPNALAHGLSRLLPLLLIAIIVGFATAIGYMLLIVPGVIVSCMCFCVIQACVVERLGVLDAIRRSLDITKGYRLKIFVLALIAGLLMAALSFLSSTIAGIISQLIFAGSDITEIAIQSVIVVTVVSAIVVSVAMAFSAVMTTLAYNDLRSIKDGSTMESLARVFE